MRRSECKCPTHYTLESARIPLLFIEDQKTVHSLSVDAAVCSVDATPSTDIMIEIRRQNEVAMRERVLQMRKSGELSKEVNVGDYARR